jgi:mycoredoxin
MAKQPANVLVYGTDWCEDTQASRNHLDMLGVPYQYINIEQDPASQEWVKQQNGGKQKTPTIKIGGQILVEPSEPELEKAVRAAGVMG